MNVAKSNGGVEILHEMVFDNGCCNIDSNMIEEGEMFTNQYGELHLCYNSEPLKINRYNFAVWPMLI